MFVILYSLLCDSPAGTSPRYLQIRLVSTRRSDTYQVRPVLAPNTWENLNPGPQFYRNLAGSYGAGISVPVLPRENNFAPRKSGQRDVAELVISNC
jgi:hypothetical protein